MIVLMALIQILRLLFSLKMISQDCCFRKTQTRKTLKKPVQPRLGGLGAIMNAVYTFQGINILRQFCTDHFGGNMRVSG